jgi:hypothetical protein
MRRVTVLQQTRTDVSKVHSASFIRIKSHEEKTGGTVITIISLTGKFGSFGNNCIVKKIQVNNRHAVPTAGLFG